MCFISLTLFIPKMIDYLIDLMLSLCRSVSNWFLSALNAKNNRHFSNGCSTTLSNLSMFPSASSYIVA
jgi:hypothetical protein